MVRKKLERLQKIDIEEIDKNTLIDIRDIISDSEKPIEERISEIYEAIGNPYCFLVGDTPVKISFSETDKTLDRAVTDHLTGVKRR